MLALTFASKNFCRYPQIAHTCKETSKRKSTKHIIILTANILKTKKQEKIKKVKAQICEISGKLLP